MPFLTSALLAGGLAAAGTIGGAAIGSHGASQAADTQSQAALAAAALQQQSGNAALDFNEQQMNLAQQNTAPYRAVGQNAIIGLNDLMGLTPVNPYPINSGGNTAPQASMTGTTPGQLATPVAPNPAYPGAPSAPVNRTFTPQTLAGKRTTAITPSPSEQQGINTAINNYRLRGNPAAATSGQGGPTHVGIHYLVGEKGPEELVMHPDGSGHVIPHVVSPPSELIHRGTGGMVQGGVPNTGGNIFGNIGTGSRSGTVNANTGGRPGVPVNQAAYGAQSQNPLITGGSPQPINNTPFSQWSQQFVAPQGMPGQFQAPTLAQAQAQPGYQFALQQGEQAAANAASATGELGDPNYARSLINYAEGAATQNYGNVFNQNLATNQQQMSDYQQHYNNALQQYQQAYNVFNNNQTNQFNRLSSLAGTGQTTTGQLNAGNMSGANNASQVLLGSAGQVGQNLNNAAAARGSGYVGSANAWGGALGNIGNNVSQYMTLQQILGQQQQQQPQQTGYDPQWLA